MNLDSKIEALLFYKSEPVTALALSRIVGETEGAVWEALKRLEESLTTRGIRLLYKNDSVLLGTAPEMSDILEKITKEELEKDLGKAALETLTIVLYKGPVRKSEIDFIRGVNSNFILRNLLVRGLVERKQNPDDERGFLYSPTFELLSFLGITKKEDLPEYGSIQEEIKKFEETFVSEEEKEKEGNPEDSKEIQ